MLWTKFSAVARAAMAAALIAAPATVVTAGPAGGSPPLGLPRLVSKGRVRNK
jgi:hypothetical protein